MIDGPSQLWPLPLPVNHDQVTYGIGILIGCIHLHVISPPPFSNRGRKLPVASDRIGLGAYPDNESVILTNRFERSLARDRDADQGNRCDNRTSR